MDQKGYPVPHERYRVVPPGSPPREGFLDDHGFARVGGIDPGTCGVSFPDLDAASWKPEKGDPGRTVAPIPVVTYSPSVGPVRVRGLFSGRPAVGPVRVAVAVFQRPSVGRVTVAVRTFPRPAVGPVTVRRLAPGVGPVTARVMSGSP